MPVAMMTTSAMRSDPAANFRRLRPLTSSILASFALVRTVTPCAFSQSSTTPAPMSSTIRGRIRGASSTTVSLAPSERIELRIVNEMKPAPTITTWLPGVIGGEHAPRLLERPEGVHAAARRRRAPARAPPRSPVAIRQSSYSTRVPSSSVHTLAFTSSAVARRPISVLTFQRVRSAPVAV